MNYIVHAYTGNRYIGTKIHSSNNEFRVGEISSVGAPKSNPQKPVNVSLAPELSVAGWMVRKVCGCIAEIDIKYIGEIGLGQWLIDNDITFT